MWSLVTSMKLLLVTSCRHSFLEYFHHPQANSDGILMKGKSSETISEHSFAKLDNNPKNLNNVTNNEL